MMEATVQQENYDTEAITETWWGNSQLEGCSGWL